MYNLNNFGYLRIAAVSPEIKVGSIAFNISKIKESVLLGLKNNCSLFLFPELSITGYTCGDLFYQTVLLEESRNAIQELAKFSDTTNTTLVVGSPVSTNGKIFNCAIVLSNGKILGIIPKTFLANTNEYYEERWFSSEFDRINNEIIWNNESIPFGTDLIFTLSGLPNCKLGIEICEDLWSLSPPSNQLAAAGANIILNLSASTEYLGKSEYRRNLIASQSARCISAYIYSSSGANESTTDLVYSGHCIIAENGIIQNESERFSFDSQIIYSDIDTEQLNNDRQKNHSFAKFSLNKIYKDIIINLNNISDTHLYRKINQLPFIPSNKNQRIDTCKEIFNIQTTGLAKRIKYIGISNVVIGISGGLDSTLALLVTIQAFNKLGISIQGIHAITMPGLGTTDRTKNNALDLAKLLGIKYQTIDISVSVNLHFKDIGHNPEQIDITYENTQARERTQILMDLANKYNGIVIGTGDLSEIALGWSTYNGDHISMYNVNAGVPKTLVKYIIEWCSEEIYSEEISTILKDICDTPISPELTPAKDGKIVQETEKLVGPYQLNDFFLYYFVRLNFSPQKILFLANIAFNGLYQTTEIKKCLINFLKRFFFNQYKRSCMPDGVKVGSIALSPRGDWRMPSDADVQTWLDNLENFVIM